MIVPSDNLTLPNVYGENTLSLTGRDFAASGYSNDFIGITFYNENIPDVQFKKISNIFCDQTIFSLRHKKNTNSENIIVWPNPFSNDLTIYIPIFNEKLTACITDISGKILFYTTGYEPEVCNELVFKLPYLSGGIYFLLVKSEKSNEIFNKKIIKL